MGRHPSAPYDEAPVYRVAEIDREIRSFLEDAYPDLWVEGEISNLRATAAGHVYFRLNDWQEPASLDAVLFRSDARRVRVDLSDGLRVRCHGRLSLYEPQGRFQLIVNRVEAAGLGELLARIEALKAKLSAEGLFDEERKRTLPRPPGCIGVVTSRGGAAIRDVIEVATRRFPVRLLVAHAAVQGESAPPEIVSGIERLARRSDVDVILVTRGGGSVEDLMAFNDERVVRAIAVCRLPVVSAVGHEVDFTLSDLAADVRAPTPSAAAEILVPERDVLLGELLDRRRQLAESLREAIRWARGDLDGLARALGDPRSTVATHRQTIDRNLTRAERATRRRVSEVRGHVAVLDRRLERLHPRARLVGDRSRLHRAAARIATAVRAQAAAARARHARGDSALAALSPLAVLGRGYSITLHARTGRAIRDPDAATSGDPLEIVVEKGRLRARVE